MWVTMSHRIWVTMSHRMWVTVSKMWFTESHRMRVTASHRMRVTASHRIWVTASHRMWVTASQRMWLTASHRMWLTASHGCLIWYFIGVSLHVLKPRISDALSIWSRICNTVSSVCTSVITDIFHKLCLMTFPHRPASFILPSRFLFRINGYVRKDKESQRRD